MELTLLDIGELLVVGMLASALNWTVTEALKRRGALSKRARRLMPTLIGLLLTLPGLPLALVWLTPRTWDDLGHPLAIVALIGLGLFLSVANAGGAQWCHAIVRTALERIGDDASNLLTPK